MEDGFAGCLSKPTKAREFPKQVRRFWEGA